MKKPLLLVLFLIFFQSLSYAKEYTLHDLIALYLENNKNIKAFKNQEEAKNFLIKKAESLRYPSLDLDLSYNFFNTEPKIKTDRGNLPASEDKYLKGELVLSYIIYDFGRRESIINQAVNDKDLIDLYLKKEKNDQVYNISRIFYQLISLYKTKSTYEEELKSLLEHKKRIEGFYEEGLVTRNEVLQVNVEISNTKQKILNTEKDIKNLKETLKLATGVDIDGEFVDTIDIDEQTISNFNQENRPEVQISKKLISLKELQLKTIDSDFYPKFYASTGINYEQNKYRVDDYNYFLSVGMKMNIFSGMSTTSEKQAIIKEIQELNEKLNLVKDVVKTDFVQAVNDYKTSKEKINVTKDAIKQAEENLKIQKGKYEEHLIPATDLIDATLLLTRANLNHILAVYENKMDYLKIIWAQGNLLKIFGGEK